MSQHLRRSARPGLGNPALPGAYGRPDGRERPGAPESPSRPCSFRPPLGPHSYSLSVTTNPQLHYNASCTKAPRFDAGTLTAVITRANATATVTIQFTGCGQYTVTVTRS